MPAMVAQRTEKRLVDRSPRELLRVLVPVEHVLERIGLPLEPEQIREANVLLNRERTRLAGIDDYVLIGRVAHRSYAVAEGAREEVVPRGETIVRSARVAIEYLVELRIARNGIGWWSEC